MCMTIVRAAAVLSKADASIHPHTLLNILLCIRIQKKNVRAFAIHGAFTLRDIVC